MGLKQRAVAAVVWGWMVVLGLGGVGCGERDPVSADPEANCVACHGADLRGSATAPSCFTCHGQEWS